MTVTVVADAAAAAAPYRVSPTPPALAPVRLAPSISRLLHSVFFSSKILPNLINNAVPNLVEQFLMSSTFAAQAVAAGATRQAPQALLCIPRGPVSELRIS